MLPPVDVKALLATARSQIGVSEHPAYSNRTPYTAWYGLVGPWCAMFVSWCFASVGSPLAITTAKGFAYCPFGVRWAKDNGCWRDVHSGYVPKPGDVIFFDFIGRPSHVGFVAEKGRMADGRVHTIEGNTNGAGSRTGGNVMEHYRSVAGGIIGYIEVQDVGAAVPTPLPPHTAPIAAKRATLGDGRTNPAKDVAALQDVLRRNGARNRTNGRPLTVDGRWGPNTKAAVIDVQRFTGLEHDGIVGPDTWAVIFVIAVRLAQQGR